MGDKPFKILTGEPVNGVDKYRPQKYHTAGQAREYASFSDMCDALPMIGRAAVKKSLGYFVPGGLIEYAVKQALRTENDTRGRRVNGNIGEIHFVAYDLDDMTPDNLQQLLDTLASSGYEAFMYHTPSSQPDAPRVRVLVELDSPQPSDTENKANLMIDIACSIWGEPSNPFTWCGVAFDKTAFREAQYMIRPHEAAESEYFEGEPVDVANLAIYEHDWPLPGVYGDGYGEGDFNDADVTDWHEWAQGRGLTLEGRKVIVLCPNRESHTSNTDGTNSTTILLPAGVHGEARFNCLHDNCDHLNRNQRDAQEACGVPPALLPDAHGQKLVPKSGFTFKQATSDDTPAPRPRKAADAPAPLRPRRERAGAAKSGKWDGQCNDYRDKLRGEVASCCNLQLWQVPPDIEAKRNKDGDIVGYISLNTADNLGWVLQLEGWVVARNTMTWEFEAFDTKGTALTRTANETDSLIQSECARRKLPDATYDRHISALASRHEVHPVREILHGRQWDGVGRVARVLECLNAEQPAYATSIMQSLLVGAISAIDDGSVEIKFCPVLFSKENDWHKSQFVHRLFGLTDRSYKGGIAIPDPTNKDSLANVLLTWGGEFGELGGMGKRDTETLKAWIPQPSDEWRPPYAKRNERKARQTVYVGTVNRDDFIKDPTIASRFPVIKLAGPVRIDTINEVLGWTYDGNRAVLTDAEQLVQFWLEVRQMKADGHSYILDKAIMQQVRATGDTFTDKGSYYATIADYLHSNPNEDVNHSWQTATNVCYLIGVNVDRCRQVGRALTQLVEEGLLSVRVNNGCSQYWFPTSLANSH